MTLWPARISAFFLGSAGFGLLIPPLAGLATRYDLFNYKLGVPLAGLGLLVAFATVLFCAILLLVPALRTVRRRLVIALVLGLPCAVLGLKLITTGGSVPVIHDISTDLQNPPAFVAAPLQRNGEHNSLAIDHDVLVQQHAGYPLLGPLQVTIAPAIVFESAHELATSMDWEIYRTDPDKLEFEAVVTTFWFGFQDDVIVRLRNDNGGTRVDMRSASRVGKSDLGANAARIDGFLTTLDTRLK